MKKLLAIGILCLSSISNAYEVPNGYILSAEDVSGNKYYVHKESIRKMGNLTYVWIISTNHVKFGKNTSAYVRRLYSYNCDTWQNKIVEETFFDDKGEELHSLELSPPHWRNLPPESVEGFLVKEICAQPKNKEIFGR